MGVMSGGVKATVGLLRARVVLGSRAYFFRIFLHKVKRDKGALLVLERLLSVESGRGEFDSVSVLHHRGTLVSRLPGLVARSGVNWGFWFRGLFWVFGTIVAGRVGGGVCSNFAEPHFVLK